MICITSKEYLFLFQIHRPISPSNNHGGQHAYSRCAITSSYENSYKRRPDGNGVMRYVHHALPSTMALLYVYLWKSLQAFEPDPRVSSLALYERGKST